MSASAAPGQLHLIASKSGRDDSIRINQDADLWLARFTNGQKVTHEPKPKRHAWVHVAEGEVTLNGKTLKGGDAAAVSGEPRLELAGKGPAQVLLFDLN